jgi:hypothetical protein
MFTNETFGMSCEKAICEIYNLPCSIENTRVSEKYVGIIRDILDDGKLIPFTPAHHVGKKNEKSDFILEDQKTLSVKSNLNGFNVCPHLGQMSKSKFCKYFEISETLTTLDIKQWIMSNVNYFIEKQISNLFCCDYILWICLKQFHIYQRNVSQEFNLDGFSWTKTLETWNESNTLKYYGKKIAEIQFHNKRNAIKIRFDIRFFSPMIIQNKNETIYDIENHLTTGIQSCPQFEYFPDFCGIYVKNQDIQNILDRKETDLPENINKITNTLKFYIEKDFTKGEACKKSSKWIGSLQSEISAVIIYGNGTFKFRDKVFKKVIWKQSVKEGDMIWIRTNLLEYKVDTSSILFLL